MRELISCMTVSPSGRLTEPLKWTLLGGIAILLTDRCGVGKYHVMTDLSGTRALVTGGTDGLGRAMAQALAEAGASVVVTSRDRRRAERVAAQLEGDAVGIALDVRDEAAVAAGVEEVFARLGGLELLVNNAGIGMRTVNPRFMTDPMPFWEVPPDGFRDVLETKATGCFLVAREVVPRMLEAGGGRIVTISMSEQTMTRRGLRSVRAVRRRGRGARARHRRRSWRARRCAPTSCCREARPPRA